MYDAFWMVISLAVNGISKEQVYSEIFELLKGKISRQDVDNFKEYIWGESHKMKKTLSREHMLSKGIPEEYVDYVIEEIKLFISRVEITDEVRSQYGYENMAIADLLWHEYCRLNHQRKSEEDEKYLKKGLFVVAESWNEPSEESIKSCIEFLKKIDSKSSMILLNIKEMKDDTKDIQNDVKSTRHTTEKINGGIEKMNSKVENIDNKLEQLLLSQGVEGRLIVEQGERWNVLLPVNALQEADPDTGERPNDLSSVNVSQEESIDIEEISPDEIMIYFVASDEFQKDIDSLKEFVEEQNSCQDAVRLKLKCYDGEAPQDIQKYKYCYMLVGAVMEEWMQVIYELVHGLNSNKIFDDKCVQLHMCFKKLSEAETVQADNNDREEWQSRYRADFNRVSLDFNDINRVKLDILQNLRADMPNVIFSTQSILQFQNNKDFAEACSKRDVLQMQYRGSNRFFSTDESIKGKSDKESLEKELKTQNEIIKKMEKDIWDNLNLLTGKLQDKSVMDAREVEAIESVIEYGNYKKADSILRNEDWNCEIADLGQFLRDKRVIMRQFISSQRTLISNLKTRGISSGLEDEIIELYKRITVLSKEWHTEYITMYEFAEFLLNQRKYKEGIKVGEELKCLYGLSDCASAEEWVRLLKLLGDLYYSDKKYGIGEQTYREALDILKKGDCEDKDLLVSTYADLAKLLWKTNKLEEAEKGLIKNSEILSSLVKSDPERYEPVLADTYNYMAILFSRRNQLDKAVEYHKKVLKMRERLAERSSSYNYKPVMKLTATYNNLAFVYKKMGEYQLAEEYYSKAIDIRNRNAKRNPSVFCPALALVYSNYATLLNISGYNDKAREVCEKAYTIRCDLMQEDPINKVEFANTLHEYGIILANAGEYMYTRARKIFEEAIEIRENLYDKDEMTYGLDMAQTYSCYGKLMAQIGAFPEDRQCYRKAEQSMRRACEICEKYSRQNKGYDDDKISEIYQEFALFLDKHLRSFQEAESYYKKAIEGWIYASRQCKRVYEPKLQKAENELKELQERVRKTV